MDKALLDWCCAREMLRRLGFTSDELFFSVNKSGVVIENGHTYNFGKPLIAIEVRRGDLKFHWTIGPTEIPPDEIEARYEEACRTWNAQALPGSDLDRAYYASEMLRAGPDLIVALRAKGFALDVSGGASANSGGLN